MLTRNALRTGKYQNSKIAAKTLKKIIVNIATLNGKKGLIIRIQRMKNSINFDTGSDISNVNSIYNMSIQLSILQELDKANLRQHFYIILKRKCD